MTTTEVNELMESFVSLMVRGEDEAICKAQLELALLNGATELGEGQAPLRSWRSYTEEAMPLAAASNYVDVMQVLFDAGVDPDVSEDGFTAIWWACRNANHEALQWLIDHGEESSIREEGEDDWIYNNEYSLAHAAIGSGSPLVLKLLLEHGLDPNVHFDKAESGDGGTMLHMAVFKRSSALIDVLLRHGASVNEKDDQERTPLDLACEIEELDVYTLRLLAEAAPDFGSLGAHYFLSRLAWPYVTHVLRYIISKTKEEEQNGAD